MKTVWKICLFSLCVVLLLPLVSCGKKQKPVETQSSSQTDPVDTVSTTDANGYLLDDLPEKMNFGLEDIKTLAWLTGKDDFETDDYASGDLVQQAVYRRNNNVMDRLNITMSFEYTTHNTDGEYVKKVATNSMSGLKEYDLFGGYTRDIASCVMQGYVQDVGGLRYVNLEKPWWPSSLKDKSVIHGKIFFVSGDIAPTTITALGVVFFNKSIIQDYGLDDPYDLVESGEWTLDKMIELSKAVYVDDGANVGEKDDTDTFGYMSNALQSQQLYWGGGMQWIVVNENGEYELSKDFVGEKMETYLSKLNDLLHVSNSGRLSSSGVKQFGAGKVLFITNALSYARSNFSQNAQLIYGIVPSPKWNAEQKSYYAAVGNASTLYSVPSDVSNVDASDATLEAMASDSYRTVSPILCEVAYGVRYAPDSTFGKIFDMIRRSVVYEPGRIFNNVFDKQVMTPAAAYNNCVNQNNSNFITYYQPSVEAINRIIAQINEGIK